MKGEERDQLIRVQLLRILNNCRDYPLPEPTFYAHAALQMPALLRAEFDENVKWLEGQGYVRGVRPDLGGPTKWTITDKGRTAL